MHYTSGKGFPIWEKSKTDPSAKCNFIRCLFPQGVNGKCVQIQILHAYLKFNLSPQLNLYFNIERVVLGCIDSYGGVQRRILQRFASCTWYNNGDYAKPPKKAIFRCDQKCRRARAKIEFTSKPTIIHLYIREKTKKLSTSPSTSLALIASFCGNKNVLGYRTHRGNEEKSKFCKKNFFEREKNFQKFLIFY